MADRGRWPERPTARTPRVGAPATGPTSAAQRAIPFPSRRRSANDGPAGSSRAGASSGSAGTAASSRARAAFGSRTAAAGDAGRLPPRPGGLLAGVSGPEGVAVRNGVAKGAAEERSAKIEVTGQGRPRIIAPPPRSPGRAARPAGSGVAAGPRPYSRGSTRSRTATGGSPGCWRPARLRGTVSPRRGSPPKGSPAASTCRRSPTTATSGCRIGAVSVDRGVGSAQRR